MKDIFTDLYNKVLGFFRQTEKKEEESAKAVACNRLKFVLMQDRTNLTPELMDRMRKELIELLSRYVEMDKEALELGFEQEGNQMALMLSIPVLRAKDEAEIEAILEKEDEEKAKKDQQTDSVEDDNAEAIEDETSDNTEETEASEEDKNTSANDENISEEIEITEEENHSEQAEKKKKKSAKTSA